MNNRLYRMTSDATIGGVAAGLGHYLKIDPTILRIAFIILTLITGGAFVFVYLAMWLLIPTAASMATEPGKIVQENLNDMGNRVRSFFGGSPAPAANGSGTPANGNGSGADPNAANAQANVGGNGGPVQVSSQPQARPNTGAILLVVLGAIFLMANMGFFHRMHFGGWFPLVLIGLGVLLLARGRENR